MLPRYRRWRNEGCPKYGMSAAEGEACQWYYDPHHDEIYEADDGAFGFGIDVIDAARSELWVYGTFVLDGGVIRIIEQKWHSYP